MRGPARPKVKAFRQLLFSAPDELRSVDRRMEGQPGPLPCRARWPASSAATHTWCAISCTLRRVSSDCSCSKVSRDRPSWSSWGDGKGGGGEGVRMPTAAPPGQPQTPLCPVHWQLVWLLLLLGCV